MGGVPRPPCGAWEQMFPDGVDDVRESSRVCERDGSQMFDCEMNFMGFDEMGDGVLGGNGSPGPTEGERGNGVGIIGMHRAILETEVEDSRGFAKRSGHGEGVLREDEGGVEGAGEVKGGSAVLRATKLVRSATQPFT